MTEVSQKEAQAIVENYCQSHNLKFKYNAKTMEYVFYKDHVIHLDRLKEGQKRFYKESVDDGLKWAHQQINLGGWTELDQERKEYKVKKIMEMIESL